MAEIKNIHKLHDEAYAAINGLADRMGMSADTIKLIPEWATDGDHYLLENDLTGYQITAHIYRPK